MPREPHNCHFCGDLVLDGYSTVTEKLEVRDYSGNRGIPSSPNIKLGKQWNSYKVRHWLSDCRPDLVEHEIGPICTWWGSKSSVVHSCYAYQDDKLPGQPWTNEHKYFYSDGPM
jgi:hypothetical protein